ncbi:antireceptor [Streptococcus phage P9853]|uniref:Antireceptor n=1 Tax=Streptococcus phage P9853 TaxID=1971445 RepID=A0A286QRR3_9CAUD|nr:virion structural protein [Streptococcus phage P9853]ARU14619.1 antireceptor [Streptococcus phage P9853]
MLLTIHDANLQKIGFIDNEKQETLNFYDDTWTRNLETASSTFEFTVSKKQLLSDTGNKHLYNQLNERSFVSFKYKGKTYLFNIMKTEENERWLRCYCENLNLELINEYTNSYKADRPRSFAEYLDVFEIPQFAMVKIGVNEISDQKRTLEWEGQETKLARLLSLANKFDAEVEFVTQLNDDSSIKQLVLNVYHKADDSHTGVGRIRGDIRLTFEKNIKSMTRKIDKTEVYTLVVPYGKSKETNGGEQEVRVYIDNLPPWEEKDDNGIVIFKQEGVNLYAPHAADLYPSTFGVSTQSNKWIRKDLEVDSDNPNVIRAAGIANLRKHAYPAITYEVDGFVDVEIGDTITIHDKGFTPALDIRARAVEQKISFSNPTNNKTTFGNFKELENRTSGDLRSVFEQMVENIRPYNILVSTDNGVMFKNNTGRSTISPTLKRGNQTVPATYRFVIDGSIVSSGLTYTVKASDITKPTVITISAWVDNKEVASEEVTFVNVSDGKQGPQGPKGDQGIPGPKGADGRTQYTHIAYADTISGSGFSQTDVNKAYIGMYQDFNAEDSKNPQDYRWSKWKGSDGRDGIPGKPGADGKTPYFHTAWAYSADGTDGFTTVYPNLNLLEGTATFDGMNPNSSDNSVSAITKTKISGIANTVMDVKTSGNAFAVGFYTQKGYNITAGQTITISFIAKASSDTSLFVGFEHFPSGHKMFTISTKWELYTYTFTATTSGTPTFVMYGWDMVAGQGFQLYNPKAELGSVATPWMPSASEVKTADYPSFIGQYTNYTQVDSPNPRDYTWSLIRGNDGKQGPQGPKGDQGIPGPKGADGRTQYTHIAYADTISGSGFSQTDVNKAYIGMYQDFNAEDSKNPQDYRWSKWKGSDGRDGIPGKPGADGRTPYVHFAYADSADGQKGFSLTQTGSKRYLGVLTNFFKEDSTNPSDYTWNDTAGSISVGGRNLLVKTNQGITNWNWQLSDGDKSVEEVEVDGIRAVKLIKGSTAANTGLNFIEYNGLLRELIQPKSKYVLSFDVKPSVDVTFYATLARGDFNEPLIDTVAMPKALANQWNKVSCVLTSKETLPNIAWQAVYLTGMPTTNGNWVIIKNIKLEEGDIPTQWTPAIEDIQDEIDSKADAAMTIEQINALNERAAIIKAEMEAKASAEILNNWIKNYQDFVKANETERAAAEKALVISSQRVSTIAKELGELSDRWNFIDTYMNSSNDGLVIGKNDGSSSMMFNPNGRISMYSAGVEVMYISQGVIHIDNGIFSKTIQVGRYREEQYHLNPDMNVIRYVGGF